MDTIERKRVIGDSVSPPSDPCFVWTHCVLSTASARKLLVHMDSSVTRADLERIQPDFAAMTAADTTRKVSHRGAGRGTWLASLVKDYSSTHKGHW